MYYIHLATYVAYMHVMYIASSCPRINKGGLNVILKIKKKPWHHLCTEPNAAIRKLWSCETPFSFFFF